MLAFKKNIHPILLYLFVIGVVVVLCITIGISWHVRKDYRVALDSMHTIADVIVSMASENLLAENYDEIETGLAKLGKHRRLKQCSIYSLTGDVLVSYPPGRVSNNAFRHISTQPYFKFFRESGELHLVVSRPISLKGKRVAVLEIFSHHPEIEKEHYHAFFYGVIVIFLLYFLILFSVRRFSLVIAKPWVEVEQSIKDIIDAGDFRRRLQDDFQDQVGDLAKTFDRVLAIVQERETKINYLEEHFEERLKERTLKLKELRDKAVEAVEARGEFLAHMSHEIRTPLNGMIGLLSLFKDVELGDEHRQLLETATRSADSLLLIVNDILDLSKIEAGMIDFESITFDLREVVEETVSLFIDMANSKGIELLCDISSDIHPYVVGDPTRLRQIITNLVGNAVKFTMDGEVVFRLKLIQKKATEQLLHFSVEDTGIGIAKKARKTIFDKFTQAEGSTTRNYGGSGLGLNVCKQLVELQKGEIGLKSEKGKGTLLWFTLPFKRVKGASPTFPCEKLKDKNILIVDDNGTSRAIIEKYLSECEAQVYASDRADRVMVLLRDLRNRGVTVDILLIDYTLPRKNGLQLASEIKIIFGEKAPQIHLLSSERGVCEIPGEHGVRSVIFKPVRQLLLYEALILAPEVIQAQKMESQNEGSKSTVLTLGGKVLLVDDEPVNQKVGIMLLRKLGLEADVAKGGREAVSMFKQGDYDLVLMDLSMPDMNGFEATELIRRYEKDKRLARKPILALTANALQSIQERCLREGMDDFISKPVRPEFLAERLEVWLPGEVKVPDHMEEGNTKLLSALKNRSEVDKTIWDGEQALQFVSGDEELFCELITLFLQRRGPLMEEINKALEARDSEALCEAAHAFKGAVNHFSAVEIRNLAQTLEDKGRSGELDNSEALIVELEGKVQGLVGSLEKILEEVC
jgi:two-component system, sensor histidine kinase and response regulator